MSFSFRRIIRIFLIFTCGCIALFIGAHIFISHSIEAELSKRNISFEKKTRSLLGLNYYNLSWKNHTSARLHIPFTYPPTLTIYHSNVFLDSLSFPDSAGETSRKATIPITIQAHEISFHSSSLPLHLPPFSGMLYPKVSLHNESIDISKESNQLNLTGNLPHSLFPNGIPFSIQTEKNTISFHANIPRFSYSHSLLSSNRVDIPPISLKGSLADKQLKAYLHLQDSTISFTGIFSAPLQIQGTWNGRVSLETLHTIFPLSETITLTGAFSAEGSLSWPDKTWDMMLNPADLNISGILFDPITLKNGTFSHTSPSTLKSHLSGPITKNWTPFSQLGWLPNTTISAEDSSFWSHKGYSIISMQEALDDYKRKKTLRGGSTITQQLAKNLFLTGEKTLERKVHELFYALSLEKSLSKEEIITTYLNIVEFGPDIHGVQKASNLYFLKKPHALSLVEASYLSSVLPAPTKFFHIAQQAKNIPRRNTNRILKNLFDAKTISKQEFNTAINTPLVVLPPTE